MKNKILLVVFLLLNFVSFSQTNYYSKSTGSLEVLANWGLNTDGTGAPPAAFTTASQIFNIRNRATATVSAAWLVSGAGSKIVVGDGVAACNFTVPATFAVTGTIDVSAAATLTIVNTSLPTLGSLSATSTVVFGRTTGGQNIPSTTYGSLTLSNTSGTNTALGNVQANTSLTTTAGGTLNMSTFALGGTLTTISNNGTISTSNTTAPIPTGRSWGGTINYTRANGGQPILSGTYNNLTLSNTSGTNTAGGDVTVNGTLTTTAGGSFSFTTATNELIGASMTVAHSGTLNMASTATTPIPTGKTWGGSVIFSSSTGGQTIPAGTFNSLTISNTSGTNTASGSLTVNASLTTSAGGTLDMATFDLGGTMTTLTSNATILTSSTGTPLRTGKSWGGTINYTRANGGQPIMSGTYNNLTLSNTSGTNTASGDITVNGTITTTAGGSFSFTATNRELIGATMTVTHSGTLNMASTAATPIPSGKTWGGTVNFSRGTGGQSIPAGTYNNLSMTATSGTNTATGAIVVNGSLTTSSNGTLNMSTFQLTGALTSVTLNGTLSTSSTANPAIPSGKTWTGTTGLVRFASTTGGQFIPAGTYKTLTCSNTSGTNTATGNLIITGAFTTSAAGGTFNLVTNTFTAGSIVNSGTLATQNTSSTPLPTGITWAGIVNYNATTGGQTIRAGTYATLRLSNTSGTSTASGNLVVNTLLNIVNAGSTLDMSTFTLTGTLTTITNNGTISTSNTSATPIAAAKTWGGTGTVAYAATTGGQTLVSGTFARLSFLNTSGTNTATGTVTVNTGLTTTAGGTLNMATFALGGTLTTVTSNGTILTSNTGTPLTTGKSWGGTINYTRANGGQTVMSGTYNNLTVSNSSGTNTAGGDITVNGTLTTTAGGNFSFTFTNRELIGAGMTVAHSGTLNMLSTAATPIPTGKTWGGTVNFSRTNGGQSIPSGTFNNLTLSNSSGTATATGAITVNGALITTSGGILAMGANQLSGSLTSLTNNGTVTTTSTANPAIPSGKTWTGTTGLVSFARTTGGQFIPAGTYKTLTCSNTSGTNTATGNLTITGAFTTSSAGGTFDLVTNTFTAGSVVNTGTLATQNTSLTPLPTGLTWAGIVNYNATTGAQTIMAGTYATLRLGNTSGINTASGNLVVNTLLSVVNAGSTLNMSTFSLSGTLTTITNNGTISTSNTSATPVTTGRTWGGTGTVRYAVTTGGQTIMAGTYTNNLELSNTSGTNTASGVLTTNGTLTVPSGGTLNMVTFAIAGTGVPAISGTVRTQSTTNPALPASKIWGGTIIFDRTNGGQNIPAGTYNNLTLSNTSGSQTARGVLTIDGALVTTNGGTLVMGANQLLGSLASVTHNGTITTTSTANPALPAGKDWSGTGGTSLVSFARTTGGQFIPGGSYKTLTATNTSNTNNLVGGDVNVTGTFTTVSAGGTLNAGTNAIAAAVISNNGTLLTQNTSANPLPSGKTWAGTVNYNGTGAQTMVAGTFTNLALSSNHSGANITLENGTISLSGNFNVTATNIGGFNTGANSFIYTGNTANTVGGITYNNLTLSNTSNTKTAGGAVVINGTLTTTSGGVFAMSTFALSGSLTSIVHNGTLTTSSTANPAIPSGKTWTGTTGLVQYINATGGQFIPLGTYKALSSTNTSGTNTATGNITVTNTFQTAGAGGTFDMGTNDLSANAITNTSATLRTQSTSATPIPTGKTIAGTVLYDATTGGQTIVTETSYLNLSMSNTSGTNTANGNIVANGALTTGTGTSVFDLSTFTLSGTLSSITGGGTVKTQNSTAAPIKVSQTWPQLIEYDRAIGGQTVVNGTYNGGLTNSNTSGVNTVAAAANITINGDLTLSASSNLSDNSTPITLNGNISGTGTHTSVTTGAITMTAASSTISSVTLGNLTLNNAAGFSLTGNPQINGTLTFTAGNLDIANNIFTFGTAAPAVAGSPASTKMIVTSGTGEVRKRYSGIGSFTFPIGDATPNYSPFTVNVTSGTLGGSAYVGVRVDDIKHPNNANADDYLNRFWHVNVSDITSPVYSISGNYVDADIVGDEADITTASYAGSLPWVTHGVVTAAANTINASALSGTNIDYSGVSNFVTTVTVSPVSASHCSGGSSVFTASSVGEPGLTYSWSPSTGLSSTTGATVTASPTTGLTQTVIVYTVTVADANGVSAATTTTLSINPVPSISATSALCPTQTATLTSTIPGGIWSSANSSVMSVNSTTGEITAVINNYSGVSYTFINYTLPTTCTASRLVTVNPVPSPISGGTTALCLGESTTLTSSSSGLTWSSSTPGVATITVGGVVNSVGAGTTTISYTNGSGCAATRVVTVNGPLPANTGTLSVCTGQTTTLSNATFGGTWSSANNTVASVNTLTGVVSGLSGGTVNISYRIGSTCFSVSQVTVNSNVAAVGGTKTVCIGTTTTLTYPVSGGTWSSATPAVATIDLNSGLVTGIGLGTSEITYTVAAGCTQTAVVTVTALPASITGTAVVCQGSTTALSNGSGTWSSSNTGIATVNSSGVVSGVSAGNANITFTASATGCYVTQEVTVNPLPVLVSAAVCPAQTATLTATPSGGTWSISNPSVATVNAATGELTGVIVNNTGISLAVATYTSLSSCVKTAVVTVNPVPSVITGGVRSICISATTTLSSSTAGAVWSSTNTGVATISVAGLVTGVGSGTTTISYTNASGCTTTADMTVSALPVVPAITGTQTVCRLSTTSLSNATPGGTWSSSNVYTATVNSSGVVTGNNAGTVRITYTLGSGCTAFSTAIVTVNHIPAVTAISGSLSICENATSNLTTISTGGVWSSSIPAVGSIGVTGIVTGITAGNTTISYTVTNGFGCVGRSTAEVTVNPVPVVDTITGTLSVCKDATTTLSSVTGGGVWTSSTPAVGTVGLTGEVTGVNAGTTIISYTVTNGFGCVTRVTKVVTVNPLPVINSLSGIFTTCENVNLLLNSNIPFGTWSSSNVSVGTIDTFAGVLVPASVGTTMVTYNVLSTGCSSTIEVTTIQAPAVIAGVTAMCPGGTTTLTTSPGGGIWTTSNSSVLTVNSATGEVAAVMVGYGGISVAGITYTIPNGCFRTVAPTVNPIPSPIYGGVTSICVGESTTFLSGSVGFTWSSSATGVATVNSGGVVTAQGAGVATISYTNSFGCANTQAVTVNAALAPNVGSSSICTGATTTFTNAIPGGTWTSSNVSKATINLTTGLVTATNAGTTTLSYMAPSGCYATNVLTINTTPAAIAGTRSVCIGSTTTLSTTPSGGVWSSSNDLLATVGSSSGIVSGVSNGTATITYTSTSGCERTAEVTVNALPSPISGVGEACASGGTTALTNVSGTWTSSNSGIASVSYLGVVTGGSAGTAIITFRNANNCATTMEVTINPLPSPLITPTGLCAGSIATLTGSPSGGTWLSSNPSVFTINASTGDMTAVIVNTSSNSLAVVTYTLPTGCSRTGLITVNRQPSPIYGGTGKVCTGSTLAQFSGTSGLTWSSASPSVATISPTGVVTGVSEGNAVISYTSAAGCVAQRVITVNTTPAVITGASSVIVGATTTLSNVTIGGTWSSSTTSRATIGSASGVVTGVSIGATNITYMMPSGCFATKSMNVVSSRGVAGEMACATPEVSIYPNPTTGTFFMSTETEGVICLYSIEGKEVLQQQISSGVNTVILPNTLAAGFYTCKFTDLEGRVTVMRLVCDNK